MKLGVWIYLAISGRAVHKNNMFILKVVFFVISWCTSGVWLHVLPLNGILGAFIASSLPAILLLNIDTERELKIFESSWMFCHCFLMVNIWCVQLWGITLYVLKWVQLGVGLVRSHDLIWNLFNLFLALDKPTLLRFHENNNNVWLYMHTLIFS